MAEIPALVTKIDQVITLSRLNELRVMLGLDRSVRLAKIAGALAQLPEGAYLIGTGPSTAGIIPLSVDEVVLGRSATPLEEPKDAVIDYAVTDALYFAPHEVSRVHAKVVNRNGEFFATDLDSTSGTFVNREEVRTESEGHRLSHGDILSLGPSQVSTYVFCRIEA